MTNSELKNIAISQIERKEEIQLSEIEECLNMVKYLDKYLNEIKDGKTTENFWRLDDISRLAENIMKKAITIKVANDELGTMKKIMNMIQG